MIIVQLEVMTQHNIGLHRSRETDIKASL